MDGGLLNLDKKLKTSDYVHLHNHTQYSLLDGLTKVPDLIDYVKEKGMESVAMTDHGTLSGALDFYKTAVENGVKPIIGIETYVAARTMHDKEPGRDKPNFHLILLAMNNRGYENLMRISTEANLSGFYYKPRVDHELLEKYNEGIIVLSGCIGGEVGDALRNDQYDKAKEIACWYKSIFGDRYYLEVQDHGHPDHPSAWAEQVEVTKKTFELADELKIKCVLTCDAHYLRHEDQDAHEILLCVQTGSFLSDEKRMSLKNFELHVTDPSELIERWGAEHPEVIKNTSEVASRCEISIELGKILIPKFDVPKGYTEKSYLEELVYNGLVDRYSDKNMTDKTLTVSEAKKLLEGKVLKRAEYELNVIDQMGFNGYFLIISDFINWGKDKGIVFGPGRGSAAGSIIAYSLRITELDPLGYDLLFERFLNPDRVSMPDIDIDIQDSRRDEVIEYCVDKYGKDRVANIVTFGRMAARNAVRDVSRVLQVPYAEADRLAKMIPPPIQGRHIPLKKSIVDDIDLKNEYESNPETKKVFDLAIQLEGTIRSHGVHAAGVVIAPDEIVKFSPLEMAQKGVVTTQYPMGPIEELGLLKMDFLGLSNLTIINNTLRIIKRVYGKEININTLPLDDKKTFELLQRGETTGVFQLESAGMKRYLKELKPTVFEDIIAMGALYRPGPLTAGLTDKFIARKNGLEKVTFDHKLMEPALKDTYGVMVYQEQFMQIVRDMCGFSGGESDTLRKAVGKKKRDMMAEMKSKVIEGAINKGVDKSIVEKFWKDLEGFADYAFNKSHAACYGLISYQTAYLKAHYPAAFMAALMTSDYDDSDRLAIEITECKHMGIKVLPPDINQSFVEFAVVPDKNEIRFGLAAVKNVGIGAVEELLSIRQEGDFNDIDDFFMRINPRLINRKVIESLIKAGAFDRFEKRDFLLHNVDVLISAANKEHKRKSSGQTDLFGNSVESETVSIRSSLSTSYEKIDSRDMLVWERELLGIYVSQHPLEAFETILEEKTVPINQITAEHDNMTVNIGGIISDSREITTKNGQKMAFVKIEDVYGEIELILFPGTYQETLGIWEKDKVILAKGKVNAKNKEGELTGETKILVNDAREITTEQAAAYTPRGKKQSIKKPKNKVATKTDKSKVEETSDKPKDNPRLYVRVVSTDSQDLLVGIKNVIDENLGDTEVVLVVGKDDKKQAIKLPQKVNSSEAVLNQLSSLVGENNVAIN
jgi:DNA polymerase-3 subunit alpha